MRTCRRFLRPQRFITLLCAVGLLLAIVACGDPDNSSDTPSSYSLSFEANGGSGSMQGIVMSPGQSATLTANAFTAPSGCAFAGWTTSITGPGTSYADQASFTMGSGDARLYAIWLPTTIKFKSNGNTVALTGYAIEPTGEFEIPVGVTLIDAKAFGGCDGLTSVEIPPSVTSIERFAFDSCSSLTDVAIPPSVISIGNGAFEYCDSLASVTIPSSVASIGEDAFFDCESLTSIFVDAANPNFSSVSGILFDKEKTKLLAAPGALSGSYAIPFGVTSIEENAFEYCRALTSVAIPSSVASIGFGAFMGCGALTGIDVDAANTNFASAAGVLFNKGKTTLIKVPEGILSDSYLIPSGVTTIEACAIISCSGLTSLTIPPSVTSIGTNAISGCSKISSVYVQAASPPALGDFNFNEMTSGYSIYVPSASLSAYQVANNWSSYSGHMQGY